jgi:molecular chaperone DnaK (HSP70)
MLKRVKGPCEQVLIEAGDNVDKIQAVEVVGLGSRIPANIDRDFWKETKANREKMTQIMFKTVKIGSCGEKFDRCKR